jgi:hypothetical protein
MKTSLKVIILVSTDSDDISVVVFWDVVCGRNEKTKDTNIIARPTYGNPYIVPT